MTTPAPADVRRRFGRLTPTPTQFRDFLLRRGPIAVKVGQHLAVRPDLLPEEYCDALMDLTDRVPPFPWAEARRIIIEDLGDRARELLESIEQEPIASGSLAQAHRARLPDGAIVAVKVQRPNLPAIVDRDLRRLRRLARLLEMAPAAFIIAPTDAVDEVADWIHQEIDFRRELSNLRILYDRVRGGRGERIPRPYPEFSGPRVLTAGYLRGIVVSDLLRDGRDGPPADRREEAAAIDRRDLGENLLQTVLRQMFRYQFFHADVHPGNLVALGGADLGFVDFGLCSELDDTVRQRQLRYLSALYEGDINRMFDAVTEVFAVGDRTDLGAFRKEFFAQTERWLASRRDPRWTGLEISHEPATLGRSPTGRYLVDVMRLARHHDLQVPPRILAMYRALLTAEAVSRRLSADADLVSVASRFFTQLRMDDVFRRMEPDRVQLLLVDALTLLQESPGQLQRLLAELSDGSFALQVDVSESAKASRAQNRRTRILATAIISVGVAVLLAGVQFGSQSPLLSRILIGILAVLYLAILLQLRKL